MLTSHRSTDGGDGLMREFPDGQQGPHGSAFDAPPKHGVLRERSGRGFGARSLFLVLAVLGALLSACGSSSKAPHVASATTQPANSGGAAWDQVVQQANTEGQVTVY